MNERYLLRVRTVQYCTWYGISTSTVQYGIEYGSVVLHHFSLEWNSYLVRTARYIRTYAVKVTIGSFQEFFIF